ncbi:MAG: hypothetical protein ABUS79_08285 [Pseudomonadota bacterium]
MGHRYLKLAGFVALIFVNVTAIAGCAFQPRRDSPGGGGGVGGSTDDGGTGGDNEPVDVVFRPDTAVEFIIAGPDIDASGPTVDANCGNQPFVVISPPPELLIVLDRSGSMREDPTTGMDCNNMNCPMSKWNLMTAAINEVVAQSETTVNWGLKFFGTGTSNQGAGACAVADVTAVDPAPMSATAIATAIAAPGNQPVTNTPTRAAVDSAAAYLMARQTMGAKYILLATDGAPNCPVTGGNGADAPGAIAAVEAAAGQGIATFVIGIAADTVAGDTLNAMAVMGGKPRAGTPQYYSVTTSADLVTALGTIQSIVKGMCTYPLGDAGPDSDPTRLTVTVDGVPFGKDEPDGWAFDPGDKSITFKGSTCDGLMAGTLKTVQLLFGCKVGPVL